MAFNGGCSPFEPCIIDAAWKRSIKWIRKRREKNQSILYTFHFKKWRQQKRINFLKTKKRLFEFTTKKKNPNFVFFFFFFLLFQMRKRELDDLSICKWNAPKKKKGELYNTRIKGVVFVDPSFIQRPTYIHYIIDRFIYMCVCSCMCIICDGLIPPAGRER